MLHKCAQVLAVVDPVAREKVAACRAAVQYVSAMQLSLWPLLWPLYSDYYAAIGMSQEVAVA